MNKLSIVFILVFLITSYGTAQNIDRQTISTSGSSISKSNSQITFTIGEVFISNYTTHSQTSEGFNQGDIELITSLPTVYVQPDLKIFPNPAHSKLFISSPSEQSINEIFLYDLKGKVIMTKKDLFFSETLELNINDLEPGYYILKITNESKKIIANQNLIKF